MAADVHIYIEGGGKGATKGLLRKGFEEFFKDVRTRAAGNGVTFRVVLCGSRDSTREAFSIAPSSNPERVNLLLVDSDGPVESDPIPHLHKKHKWDLQGVAADRCHLMVQIMEAWFLADVNALQNYYGAGFRAKAIPKNLDVERTAKSEVESSLKEATKGTGHGPYHKTRHAPELLKRLDVSKVRKAAKHCNRLFETLELLTQGDSPAA